ncbi:alpha/beta fold hydrolase [Adlercreutzia sp. ZJ242]|uniref:alpha/beta fold hydrolase n=1 Tax=Adlercreutzia sp. ZJ242 TaxID=2709409 RepID=UPI0013ECF678|nr:alpha/beta fold hydrolase [Adlercreutzia sp. ZJ242]
MLYPVERTALGFSSADGKSQIKGLLWRPAGAAPSVRGIVQIVHGMSEHAGRYDAFARELAAHGYVACAHDHIGHGKSVTDPEDWGHMPARGGAEVLVEDVDALRRLVSARFARSVPYFVFGHSMGSFVTRVYLTRHAEGLAGAILCGTGNKPRAVSKAGNVIARTIARVSGERAASPFLRSVADGAYSRAVENARTPFDWLSANEANVDAFIADELCGRPFTAGGYAALTALTYDAARLDLAAKIPPDLPILFIAGSHDPVGDNGEGVRASAEIMRAAGVESVEVVLYQGMRHEILNEDGRERVYADVLTWLEAHRAPAA